MHVLDIQLSQNVDYITALDIELYLHVTVYIWSLLLVPVVPILYKTTCLINPLTTEFFPPRPHIFMHSAHTTFVGTPLPQHSLLSRQTWWGPHTWRDPSGNTVNDIHDPPQAQQSEVKGGCQPNFCPAFP